MIGTVAVTLGVVVGIRELRHFSKDREAEVLRDISARLSSMEGFSLVTRMSYKTFDEIEGKPEETALYRWLNALEEMGILVKRGIISIDLVDDFWHGAVRLIWTRSEPVIKSYRAKYNHPEFGEWAEYLYLRIYGSGTEDMSRVKELEHRVNLKKER